MNKKHLDCGPRSSCAVICRLLAVAVLFGMLVGVSCRAPKDERIAAQPVEPNAELAYAWWPPHRNVWTPIGWKDHLFRFHVLYNGTIVAKPYLNKSTGLENWAGRDFQLTVTPSADSEIPAPPGREPYQLSGGPDRGTGNQGWAANSTPVLWTEWPLSEDGLVLREEVFAHIPGDGDVETGSEPLYAWIRLSVGHVDEFKAPENFNFIIHLGADHIQKSMEQENNLKVFPDRSAYPVKLTADNFSEGARLGCRILEPDGGVRLVGVPSDCAVFTFKQRRLSPADRGISTGRDYFLMVTLPVRKGAYADLLLPMIPGEWKVIKAELALGFEGALAESDRYWSVVPETAARIETPEQQVNEAIARSVRFAELISRKNPETGEYSFLSGSWHYERLWATPTSMTSHMLLDNLGYHSVVEKHIEIFRLNQGTVKPPGTSYDLHPGYFSTPRNLTSIDWLSDNGAVLYEVSRHALLTGDRKFLDRWLEAVIRCCEFIKDARAIKGHHGIEGVLPPAVATDRRVPNQSGWNIGWNYKGLSTAVRLLNRIGHPQAEEFAREAGEYKETFVRALRAATAAMPQWTDREGAGHPVVPLSLSAGGDNSHAFYLDTGPLFFVWSGLMQATDPLMRSTIDFFREGPNTAVFDPRGNCWQRPVLIHEISSCEPCYSWNIYHSWQLADRYRFLEGMYSLLAGALSRQTYISCETRHGIYGNIFASTMLVDLARLCVIDDQIAEHELHLLRLVPLAWIRNDYRTRFENMPTEFGPVTITFKLTDNSTALDISYKHKFRDRPNKVLLHVPPVAGLEQVIVNGRPVEAGPGDLVSVE